MSNKLLPLTPRETSIVLILRHSPTPLTLEEICAESGYRYLQPFRASARFLEAEKQIISAVNARGQSVYAIHPQQQAL